MEIFRIQQSDMMGLTISEHFFTKLEKAEEKFEEMIEAYRNNENLASKEDAEEHHMNNESISITKAHLDYIKQAMVCLWYRCSYECDEWDITVEHLDLKKINVVD